LPTSAEVVLLDTSAALAWVDRDHQFHASVDARLVGHRLGLAGHAAFETYSVLTRRQPPKRLAASTARWLIEAEFPESRLLTAQSVNGLLAQFAAAGVAGGAVYDGLVATAAKEGDLLLVSCDVRAAATYRALGVMFELVGAGSLR
jgi:predicted nucleic acid-binding protein